MKCDTAQLIFFSPTKTTMKIVDAIGEGMRLSTLSRIDLTFPLDTAPQEQASDVVVIGTPVHAGRVPALAVDRLRQNVQGKGRPAVLVVVYGNRAYEDALLELRNVAEELGFVPVGAAAFIGEHSFSTSELPVAAGRPDVDDLKKARVFGSQVVEKMQKIISLDQLPALHVPGHFPYRDGIQPGPIAPDTHEALCTLCGECARMCPSQVVHVTDTGVVTDPIGCIRCSACIKVCPTGARFWNVPKIHEVATFLHTHHAEPRKPETFL
jgi:ferredoxin